jgi:hypothetical protein
MIPHIWQKEDEENIYGPVVWCKGDITVREKDGVVAVYVGERLAWTGDSTSRLEVHLPEDRLAGRVR